MITSLVYGSMFSGKTTRLLRTVELCKRYGLSFYIIKPTFDTRFGDKIIKNHDGEVYTGKEIFILGADSLPKKSKAKFILVDEAQFFSIDEVRFIEEKFRGTASFITFYGLLKDYADEYFPTTKYLYNRVDIREECYAKCAMPECENPATKTQRLLDGKPAGIGPKLMLGGASTYEARCELCYYPPQLVEMEPGV